MIEYGECHGNKEHLVAKLLSEKNGERKQNMKI